MKNNKKIAWLIMGAILILGIIASNISNGFQVEKSGGGIWSDIGTNLNTYQENVLIGSGKDKIALIKIEGVLIDGSVEPASILSSSGEISAQTIVRQIDQAKVDPEVKAVILEINSAGGTAVAGQTVTEKLQDLKSSGKKIYVAMREVAASAAYEISTPADKIFANPETITGSIGVIMQLSNYQGLYEKIGYDVITIKSGEEKDLGNPARNMTETERNILQEMVNESYNNFVKTVAVNRRMEEAKVRELADGRVYTASQAKTNGLIDELGNLDAVISQAKKDLGMGEAKVIGYQLDPISSYLMRFLQKINLNLSFSGLSTSNNYRNNQLMHLWVAQ